MITSRPFPRQLVLRAVFAVLALAAGVAGFLASSPWLRLPALAVAAGSLFVLGAGLWSGRRSIAAGGVRALALGAAPLLIAGAMVTAAGPLAGPLLAASAVEQQAGGSLADSAGASMLLTKSSACNESTSYINSSGNCVHRPEAAGSAPAGATAKCRDGEYSLSQHRTGTCSGHGGVAQWL
jgi:hypothetical protein